MISCCFLIKECGLPLAPVNGLKHAIWKDWMLGGTFIYPFLHGSINTNLWFHSWEIRYDGYDEPL